MKPYVICHMLMSIYGKVTGKFLSEESIATSIERYYEINRKLKVKSQILVAYKSSYAPNSFVAASAEADDKIINALSNKQTNFFIYSYPFVIVC